MCGDWVGMFARILAAQQEGFQDISAVFGKGGLLRRSAPSRGFNIAGLCTPGSWNHKIRMEQCYDCINADPLDYLLACLLRLDRLALVWQENLSYASYFAIARSIQSANRSSDNVSCSPINVGVILIKLALYS